MSENFDCHFCGQKATTQQGTIYVRYQVGDKWENVPECRKCWDIARHTK